ncbi:hypothetical protein F2P44_28520 [Massilia sp. CCM 8695]|uniref:Uncharacterized protein n=1 Tax=Massilia frigida TaxID=2609281 RepID=A0ABX0NI30_9BURK|nr:hypothetical protein [Massilia frigida]NHZ83189.1 hypothetical protein [Massilia frigida]
MFYRDLPRVETVKISHVGGVVEFSSVPMNFRWHYSMGFGAEDVRQNGREGSLRIRAPGAVHIMNLISCAAVCYVYTDLNGVLLNVSLCHAHTGMIREADLPTAPALNVSGVAPAQIHVVFASSQSSKAVANDGIETAASGLIDLVNLKIPKQNIIVVTGTGTRFGINYLGEVGAVAGSEVWRGGNLSNVLLEAATAALTLYEAHFAAGVSAIGNGCNPWRLGGHRLSTGNERALRLRAGVTAARTDRERLRVLNDFLNGSGSYKGGSLKRLLVRQLHSQLFPLAVALGDTDTEHEVRLRVTQITQHILGV